MTEEHRQTGRILAFFAHPDDELSVGGTLARYASNGAEITLVCATRGEAATIYSPPEYGATPENLAQIRTAELECCCQTLGIGDLRWMDWPDGQVATRPRDEAIAGIVAIIRQVRPQVMITHPSNGGYPHPDHIAVHEIAVAAWQAAADPTYRPPLGPAHAAARLFCRVIPASLFQTVPALQEYRVHLNGQQLPFYGVPDATIDTVVDVAAWLDRRDKAWACHRSQHNPNSMFSRMPKDVQQAFRSREHLQLIAQRSPATGGRANDLFAGL